MILDMNMWKNQIFYAPIDYGQYTDSEGKIHTIKDEYSLEVDTKFSVHDTFL
jgi:hypothetical protein